MTYNQKYYLTHRTEIIKRNTKYYLNHKKQKLEYISKWQQQNKEAHNAANRKYRKNHKKERQIVIKKWFKNHPEYVRLKNIRRHSKRGLRVPKFGQEGIKEFYKNCPKGRVIDHVVPLCGKFVSGLHVIWNLQYLTPKKNWAKGNKELL